MKVQNNPSFADTICDVRVRKIKSQFFHQVDTLLDWKPISEIIDLHYKKGKSAVGAPSYDGLLLFRMCLLQTWYGLSDYEVEDRINDSISRDRKNAYAKSYGGYVLQFISKSRDNCVKL